MARNIGYGLIFAVCFFTSSQNDFKEELWKLPPPGAPLAIELFVSRLILFLILLILAFRWIIATNHELHIWLRWLDNPFQRNEVYGAFFSLSVFLGIAVAFPHHVVVITALLTSGLLLNYWTQWLANEQFERAVQRTQQRTLGRKRTAVIPILIKYWMERPQLGRIAVMMFVAGLAYSFAFAGLFAPRVTSTRFELTANVILIADIAIGESVVSVWRHRRDRAIMEIDF